MGEHLTSFFNKRPGIFKKSQDNGNFSEYASNILKHLKPADKSNSFIDIIIQEVKRNHPGIDESKLESQLTQYPLISYADHHGLLHYNLLYNSNILYSEMIKQLNLPYLPVFATGNIPLSNISYPRGFYFCNEKFNFFSKRKSNIPVYLFDDKIKANRKSGIDSILLNLNQNAIDKEKKLFLEYLFFDCLEIENAGETNKIFSDQVSFLNGKIWNHFFDKSIRENNPELLYIQSNEVIKEALIRELEKKDSLVSSIIFDPEVRNVFLKNYHNIQGCWGDNSGSQLFWGISDKKKTIRLTIENNHLTGNNFNLPIEKDIIIQALKDKKILPAILFEFLIVVFFNGFLALGGFNQIEYLPRMQSALLKSIDEIGRDEYREQFSSAVTDGLICGMFPFDFNSSIDLMWSYNSTNGKFNGNLDRGITGDELRAVNETKIRDMIYSAIETMKDIA